MDFKNCNKQKVLLAHCYFARFLTKENEHVATTEKKIYIFKQHYCCHLHVENWFNTFFFMYFIVTIKHENFNIILIYFKRLNGMYCR